MDCPHIWIEYAPRKVGCCCNLFHHHCRKGMFVDSPERNGAAVKLLLVDGVGIGRMVTVRSESRGDL